MAISKAILKSRKVTTLVGERRVWFYEAMVCTSLRKETVRTGRELILQAMHNSDKKDAFKHLTEAGSEGDGPECIGSRFWHWKNCVGGLARRHIQLTKAKADEV